MAGEISLAGLRAEQEARRAGIAAWVQSVVIFLLLVGMAEDYNHSQYFQSWAVTHLAGLGFLLNGAGATFYAGILIGLFLKSPLAYNVGNMIRRKEPVLSDSVLRFYNEIAVLTSEPGNLITRTPGKNHDFVNGGAREKQTPPGGPRLVSRKE